MKRLLIKINVVGQVTSLFISVLYTLSFPLVCFSYDYDVSGYDDSGNYIYGDVDVDQSGGDGYIYLEDGEEKHIDVDWTGKGELEGYDEDGNYYELEVE